MEFNIYHILDDINLIKLTSCNDKTHAKFRTVRHVFGKWRWHPLWAQKRHHCLTEHHGSFYAHSRVYITLIICCDCEMWNSKKSAVNILVLVSLAFHSKRILYSVLGRRVWGYQRGNQNPYIEEEQTKQWPK